ncbi:type B 50S ribosomal protein L31 [Propionibacterium australiense]|uniref:50S ribosomal protein L31 n=1 Tax=Propionibacterium australiense TaxID=119981 RepID=A0A383S2S9_9ACTN|nr:type B 50S ribosomal protein L31 [Propionibacterium australiense]RLP06471.1 type B 50S ribosomal protein L31 [Propionibacterium australiense]RLP11584.1 type B 50S ribosomal protein L31 [Propionibacterium australiense]SYZ32305.1 Ribosomal protein L31 [Propionibacterium australiense]VEH90476.1 50S ribosomal protein L31 type B [Propionibacterium australiense]
MKRGIHPVYQPVVFRDNATGEMFLTRSTLGSSETVEFNGEIYPLVRVEISSSSHPFWTGRSREIDTEGRIERFRRRYGD